MCIHIFIFIYICTYMYTYIYIYVYSSDIAEIDVLFIQFGAKYAICINMTSENSGLYLKCVCDFMFIYMHIFTYISHVNVT